MKTDARKSRTHLLRGPLVASAAIVAWAAPYLATLSPRLLLCSMLVFGGLLLFFRDLLRFAETTTRTTLREMLDGLVLDDVLRTIYDPETGIVACDTKCEAISVTIYIAFSLIARSFDETVFIFFVGI